jgi:hypothetical protein
MRARILSAVFPAWIALAVIAVIAVIAGCASSPARDGDRIDSAFRAIQRSEARIEAAGRQVDRVATSIAPDAGACVERCELLVQASSEAAAGAAGVCQTAAALDDGDARTRCERAKSRSAAIEQRAAELRMRCGCGAAP